MSSFLQFGLPLVLSLGILLVLATTFVAWVRQRSLGEPPGYFKLFPGAHRQ